jgi:hypothetical protein
MTAILRIASAICFRNVEGGAKDNRFAVEGSGRVPPCATGRQAASNDLICVSLSEREGGIMSFRRARVFKSFALPASPLRQPSRMLVWNVEVHLLRAPALRSACSADLLVGAAEAAPVFVERLPLYTAGGVLMSADREDRIDDPAIVDAATLRGLLGSSGARSQRSRSRP